MVSGADQDNEILVRGGMPGENLFVMDNIEIPNPNHFGYQGTGGGPINMINTYFVRRVDFYAGAFPARYGDRASSAMDITLREGNRQKFAGHAYLGMAGAGMLFEGPLVRDRGSFILSARKSFLDLVISQTGLTAVPHYYSLQGKGAYDVSPNNLLLLNAIYGNDEITIESEEQDAGYTRGADNVRSKSYQYAFGATLQTLYGGKGVGKVTLSQTLNNWDQYVYNDRREPYYTNLSTEIERTLKYDATALPRKNIEINFGAHVKAVQYDIAEWAEADTVFVYDLTVKPPRRIGPYRVYDVFQRRSEKSTVKTAGWLQLKWQPFHRLSLSAGSRWDYFRLTGHHAIDPRMGLSYQVGPATKLNLAVGKQSQSPVYIQLTEHPQNSDLDFKETRQAVLGLEHLFREDVRATLEFFYKDYAKVPMAVSSLTPDPWDASYGRMVNKGKGYAKGVEFFIQKKLSTQLHYTVSYAYTISKAYDPRYQEYYNWDYDYRHIFTFISGVKFNLFQHAWYQRFSKTLFCKVFGFFLPLADQVDASIRWRYLGGRPYTEPVYYPQLRQWITDENVRFNRNRYPVYHRLDLRLDRRYMFDGWNIVTYFDIMNVYGRDNIWGYSYNGDGTIDNVYQWKVFPVGGITIEF